MFSNHPDAGSLPITLLISTLEHSNVSYTIKSSDGIIFEGNINSAETNKVLLPDSYVVSDVTDTDKGLVIETDGGERISVSVSNHYIYSSDSYLALPLIEYIDVEWYTYFAVTPDINTTGLHNRILLIGGHDNTVVAVSATSEANISTEVVTDGILYEGETYSFLLNELNTVLIESEYPLTGYKVTANKPITFLSGHQCAAVPETGSSCDFAIEQLPPTITWGTEFLFPLIASRTGGSYFTIISSSANTQADLWCYSNTSKTNITDEIIFSESGEYINVLVAPDDIFCSVISNKSIMITLIATSEDIDYTSGDPFMMMVPPVEQFYNNVTLVVPDDDFETNFVNIISLEDNILVNGDTVESWIDVHGIQNDQLGFASQFQIYDDVNELSSSGSNLFAANVYGFNFSVGYGQIAGMNLLITQGNLKLHLH